MAKVPLLQNDEEFRTTEDDDSLMDDVVDNYSKDVKIKIDIPQARPKNRYPSEVWKTVIAFVFLQSNIVLSAISLSIVHDRVPDRDKVDPLSDIFLDHVTPVDWALNASECLIITAVITTVVVILFHKHRSIIFRRVCFILGLLYMMRAITMFVTVVPVASKTYYCSPKANSTSTLVVAKRVWQLLAGVGLSINGKQTYCGDYIYSGHTVALVLSYLTIVEYSSRKLFPLHWFSWLLSVSGIALLLTAHGHYTIDILIAYYATTTLFWIYHTLANNKDLKKTSSNNMLSKLWWFRIFLYFEGNVSGPIPRIYSFPMFNFKSKRLNS